MYCLLTSECIPLWTLHSTKSCGGFMSCRVTETVTVHSRWRAEFCDQPKQFPTGRFSLGLAHRFDAFISLLQTIGTEAWFIQKESQVTQINGRKAERNANQCTSIRSRRTSSFRAALRGSACSGQEGSGICSSLICLVIHNCPAAGIWSKGEPVDFTD
jgi:hypothetical protein